MCYSLVIMPFTCKLRKHYLALISLLVLNIQYALKCKNFQNRENLICMLFFLDRIVKGTS